MSERLASVSLMAADLTLTTNRIDRASFSTATSSRRLALTAEWLTVADVDPADVEFVRRVRERDLADARALFAPNLTMVAILTTLLALSITWGMLLGAIVAPVGVLIGLVGSWLALRRIMTTSRQLAQLDARAV